MGLILFKPLPEDYSRKLSYLCEEMPHTQRVHKLVYQALLLSFISPDVLACQHHVKHSRETHLLIHNRQNTQSVS